MSRNDAYTRNAFVTDEEGRILYYPRGQKKMGYVLPDMLRKAAIEKSVKRYETLTYIVMIAMIFMSVALFDSNHYTLFAIGAGFFVLRHLTYLWYVKKLVANLQNTVDGMTQSQININLANSMTIFQIIISLLISVFGFLAMLYGLSLTEIVSLLKYGIADISIDIATILLIVMTGIFTYSAIYMLWLLQYKINKER